MSLKFDVVETSKEMLHGTGFDSENKPLCKGSDGTKSGMSGGDDNSSAQCIQGKFKSVPMAWPF